MAERIPRSGTIVMQPAQSESRALDGRNFHATANNRLRHHVQFTHLERIHAVISADRHSISGPQLQQKLVRIHAHRLVCARESLLQGRFRPPPQPRFALLRHSLNLTARTRRKPLGENLSSQLWRPRLTFYDPRPTPSWKSGPSRAADETLEQAALDPEGRWSPPATRYSPLIPCASIILTQCQLENCRLSPWAAWASSA